MSVTRSRISRMAPPPRIDGTRDARVPTSAEGLGRPRDYGVVWEGRAGMCPRGEDQGQWTVVRRRLAARSSANRPSCQGVR